MAISILCIIFTITRRDRDSNPGYPFGIHTLSRRAPSTTRPPLLLLLATNTGLYSNNATKLRYFFDIFSIL
jgi:hypothetical protein